MASTLVAMASNLEAMASNLPAMASYLIANFVYVQVHLAFDVSVLQMGPVFPDLDQSHLLLTMSHSTSVTPLHLNILACCFFTVPSNPCTFV